MNKAEIGVGIKGDTSDIKKKVGSLGSELKSSMSGLTGMIAGAFSVGAVVSFGKSLIDTAHQIQNTSEALGVGTDSLQTLKAMAADSGIQFEEVAAALNRITKAQSEALTGSAPLSKAFKALGISSQDLQSMAPDQIMQRIGASLKEGGRSAEETGAAFDILDKSSGKMLGFLQELGSQGLDASIQKFKDIGLVMDEVAIKQFDQAGDAIERFKIRSQTVAGEVLIGWEILFDTLVGMSTGMSLEQANAAAALGLGMMGGDKKKTAATNENDLPAATAEDNKWYDAMEAKLLRNMNLTQRITYYEQEISDLQKSRAQNPTDLTIATQILEREKKIADIKDKQAQLDEAASTKLDAQYAAEDKLAADYAKKRKDITGPNDTALMGPSRVDSLQAIGGLIGNAGGQGDQSARAAERQEKIQKDISDLVRETNTKLDELSSKLDGIVEA